jgi:nitrogen fixation protein NifU and related proteins
MYSPQLLEHFEHPRNAGEVSDPDATAQVENPACGDILKLTVRIRDRRIAEIRFRAKGCVPAMACGSAITELAKGKTVSEALNLTSHEVLAAVGDLPPTSSHAGQLAIDALRAVLKQLRT